MSGADVQGADPLGADALDADALDAALRAGRVEALLVRAERARGVAARRYAIELVARAVLLADPGTVPAELLARARAVGVEEAAIAAAEDEAPPHAVRIPLVEAARGDAFVRALWIEFDPIASGRPDDVADDGRLRLDGSARDALGSALARAAELAPPPRDHARFRVVAARPAAFEGARIEGESLAAGALVSAVSLWGERAVRRGVAVTGALRGDAIARVGSVAAKVRAAAEAGCTTIVLPRENEDEARACGAAIAIVAVARVEDLLEHTLVPERAHVDPELAVREARAAFAEGWRGYRWPSISERLSRALGALPHTRPDLSIEILARLAAARRHLGDPEGSLRVLESARAIAESDSARAAVPDAPLALLEQQRAMTELKLFRFAEAARAAKRAVAIARRARLRGEGIKALGCAGLVAMARGRWESARRAFEDALEATLAHAPGDAARSRVYLIDALGRLGREPEARAQWSLAMDEVDRGDARARRTKEAWVRVGWGGALVAMGRWAEAIEALDVAAVARAIREDPLPGLLARRHLGVALARAGDAPRGLELLASSAGAYGRALEPGVRSLALVNVLVEAELRIALAGELVGARWDDDARARTAAALAALPSYGAAERWLGPARATAEDALRERDDARLARALRALLARCEAI